MRHRNLLQSSVNLRQLLIVPFLLNHFIVQNYIASIMAEGIDRRADGEEIKISSYSC